VCAIRATSPRTCEKSRSSLSKRSPTAIISGAMPQDKRCAHGVVGYFDRLWEASDLVAPLEAEERMTERAAWGIIGHGAKGHLPILPRAQTWLPSFWVCRTEEVSRATRERATQRADPDRPGAQFTILHLSGRPGTIGAAIVPQPLTPARPGQPRITRFWRH